MTHTICANCVMDTTDTKITFDKDGVCDHCTTFYRDVRPNWHTDEYGRKQLETELERIRIDGKGRDFDCIIGMSGGIDSSYLTHLAKCELTVNAANLRPFSKIAFIIFGDITGLALWF